MGVLRADAKRDDLPEGFCPSPLTVRFVLPGLTLSQNAFDRVHWSERHRLRDDWFWLVKGTAGTKNPKTAHPATLEITRIAKRLIDLPNIGSACKPIIDALVTFGWLRGDGPKDLLAFTVAQRKPEDGEAEHMEVEITYLPAQEA